MHSFFYQRLHVFNLIFAGFLLESSLTHGVGAQRRMTDVACVINAFRKIVDSVQKLRKGFPSPVDTCEHGITRQVFGAFQVTKYQVSILLLTRRKGKTAVTHHHTGNAVIAGAGTDGVPKDLCVHMGMTVDKAGGNHMTLCIDGLFSFFVNATNFRDFAAFNRNVGSIPGTA